MNTRRSLVAIALTASLPFALASCGSSSQADHAKASIKAMLIKDQKTDAATPRMTDDQSGCIANTAVDKIGIKGLQTAGMLDKKNNAVSSGMSNAKMSASDASTFVDALFDCTNGGKTIIAATKKEIDGSVPGAPASALACINSKITTEFTKDLFKAVFARDNAKINAVQASVASCMSTSK
ncbi:MAG: hypothetical protein ACTHJM_14120 [Marmoricola sp.]